MDDIAGDASTSASDFARAQAQERDAAKHGIAGLKKNNGHVWKRSELRDQKVFAANENEIRAAAAAGQIVDDISSPPTRHPLGMKTGPASRGAK